MDQLGDDLTVCGVVCPEDNVNCSFLDSVQFVHFVCRGVTRTRHVRRSSSWVG